MLIVKIRCNTSKAHSQSNDDTAEGCSTRREFALGNKLVSARARVERDEKKKKKKIWILLFLLLFIKDWTPELFHFFVSFRGVWGGGGGVDSFVQILPPPFTCQVVLGPSETRSSQELARACVCARVCVCACVRPLLLLNLAAMILDPRWRLFHRSDGCV